LGGIHPIVPTLIAALLAFIVGAYTGKASDEKVLKLFWEEEDA
jgi:Na+/pantothenate symporter